MLSELRLENFRGFEDHTIPLRPLTIVVGRNNAGKSTIVEALRIVSIALGRRQSWSMRPLPEWLRDRPIGRSGTSPSLRNMEISTEGLFHRKS